jgi:hypothetical protein
MEPATRIAAWFGTAASADTEGTLSKYANKADTLCEEMNVRSGGGVAIHLPSTFDVVFGYLPPRFWLLEAGRGLIQSNRLNNLISMNQNVIWHGQNLVPRF